MNRTCRLCDDRQGTYRTVRVGDGLSRLWAICDDCVDTLREASWVTVDCADEPQRVVLRVAPEALSDSFHGDDQ